MADGWQRGERPTAAEILKRHPELDGEAAVRLIYEEVCLRREAGLDYRTSEVIRHYPRWRNDLEPLLGADRLLRSPALSTEIPEPGELLGDFRLLAELGRGSAGKTFLAAQPSLADRPVVLKVTAFGHDEHLSLARLQHTHIVPLYSEQVFPDRALRALCMPFLGGATLALVLDELAAIPHDRRRGADILSALDRLDSATIKGVEPKAIGSEPSGPYRRFLNQSNYIQWVCLVAACLADALQYAHDRGLVHLDVKPSNVLIASDGQPLLLDFHLAAEPLSRGAEPPSRLGGTPGWTSPEQDAAMRAAAAIRTIPGAVDGRSDVYSLGLLILAMLGGRAPELEKTGGVRIGIGRINPKVTPGMADIVAHCLETDPEGRYPSAQALADDLRQQLNDLPLKGVPNRSLSERWAKWRRRRPESLARGSATLAVAIATLIVVGISWIASSSRIQSVKVALADAKRLRNAHRFEDARLAAERGLELSNNFLISKRLGAELSEEMQRSERGELVNELNQYTNAFRFLSASETRAEEKLREFAPRFRIVWEDRKLLTGKTGRGLDEETERQLVIDLREIAIVSANLRIRFALAGDRKQALSEAWSVLNDAEKELGTSPALSRSRCALSQQLGIPGPSGDKVPEARSTWEHDELGRYYLLSNATENAENEFRRALDLDPTNFFANFHEGRSAYLRGDFNEALAAFRACVTLRPAQAECRVNRGMAYERLNRSAEAEFDYSQAIALNPKLAEAYLSRGLFYADHRRYANAVKDFRQALEIPDGRETRALTRYNLALALRALGDSHGAEIEAKKARDLGFEDASKLLAKPR